MRLPAVLTATDLPAPELNAARLDGDVFAVGGCFAPVDEIEQPRHRAAAVHAGLSGRLIAEQLSAAWVWGALDQPPAQHQFCVDMDARVSHIPGRWITVREVVIEPGDVVELEGQFVTTRLRTMIDLARFSESFDSTEVEVVRRLGDDVGLAIRLASGRRNLPHKQRTLARLGAALPGAELPQAESVAGAALARR